MDSVSEQGQRGISRVGIVATIVVAIGLAGIGWWIFRDDNGGGNNGGSTTTQEQRDAVENARCDYDDQDLCKFFASWKATRHYTIESTSETNSQTATTRIQHKDDKTRVEFSGDISYETIVVGNTLYTKAGDSWYKQALSPGESSKYQGGVDTNLTEPDPGNGTQVTYTRVGTEKCGEETCFKYEVDDGSAPETTQYIWFDNENYRLRRLQVSATGSAYDAVFSYQDVSINAPSPVRELGSGQQLTPGQNAPTTTLPGTGDTPSPEELEKILGQYQ